MADRRRVLALAAGGLLLGGAALAAEEDAPGSQLLASGVQTSLGPIDFQLYLPAGYAASGAARHPLLLLLHGRGDRMAAWTRVRPLLDRLIREGRIPPLIAVMPDAPWSRRGGYYVDSAHEGGSPVETLLMRELLPHIDAQWRTRREREARIISGYSMGGYGALRYALAWPGQFGAALVLSPAVYTPLPPLGSSAREFGGFGRGSELFVDAIYRERNYPALLADAAELRRDLPLRVFIAAGDQEYKNPRALRSAA
ncbi:alpha/beta hydrolase [Burkholderiaceae bacterium UC74_6]